MLNIQVIHDLFNSALISWFITIRASEFKKLMVVDMDSHSDEYDREELNNYVYVISS